VTFVDDAVLDRAGRRRRIARARVGIARTAPRSPDASAPARPFDAPLRGTSSGRSCGTLHARRRPHVCRRRRPSDSSLARLLLAYEQRKMARGRQGATCLPAPRCKLGIGGTAADDGRATFLAAHLSSALRYRHVEGIVHLGVQPSNGVGDNGRAKRISNLSIARPCRGDAAGSGKCARWRPQQARGDTVGAAAGVPGPRCPAGGPPSPGQSVRALGRPRTPRSIAAPIAWAAIGGCEATSSR
jgi:hypothetical protein